MAESMMRHALRQLRDEQVERPQMARCEVRFHESAPALALANRLKEKRRWYQYEYNRIPVGGVARYVVRYDGFVSVDPESGETRITEDPR